MKMLDFPDPRVSGVENMQKTINWSALAKFQVITLHINKDFRGQNIRMFWDVM